MHTPANWTVVYTGPARIPRIESDGIPVALMFQESAHHAALIAAAPDLLAFAQSVANYPGADAGLVIAAREVIAKALGE